MCNDSRGLSLRFEHVPMCVKWRKGTYEWMGRRERGKRCEPHTAWTNMKRHSEGHGCLWKCLCELRQGKKNIWGAFSVWHLKTAGWKSQWLVSPCINLLTPVQRLTARGAFLLSSPVWFSTIWSDVCEGSSHQGHGDPKLYPKIVTRLQKNSWEAYGYRTFPNFKQPKHKWLHITELNKLNLTAWWERTTNT